MANLTRDDVVVARVVNEDDDFLLVEIPKNNNHVFHLDENVESNRFLTMLFVEIKNGKPVFEKPWEKLGE